MIGRQRRPREATTHRQQPAIQVTVYVAEPHTHDRRGAVDRLLHRAAEAGLAGGTVLAAYEGFGRRHSHEPTFWKAADETPLILTMVESPERVDLLLALLDEELPDAVTVTGPVRIIRYFRTSTRSPGGPVVREQ